MSDKDSYGFSDFEYDDELFHEPASHGATSFEDERPNKRRRLNSENKTQSRGCESNLELDAESDDSNHCVLPNSKILRKDRNNVDKKAAARKPKIYTPTYRVDPEPMFVSQTQPPSSPSRIRGPRWKAPGRKASNSYSKGNNIEPSPTLADKEPSVSGRYQDRINEDTDAAIAASLQSFRVEQLARGATESFEDLIAEPDVVQPRTALDPVDTEGKEAAFDLDDIPDDVFDFEPEYSRNTTNEPISISSQPRPSQIASPRRADSQSTTLKQTTLYGGFANSSTKSSSQSVRRSWPLANQHEPPTHHQLNENALRRWIFPKNLGRKRQYQFNIAYRALFHNLLVALPTGLGKTFIAATVMLNWFNWTKDAQIVFVAPTKPLVSQQVEACFNIVGIPRSKTTLLTGNTSPGVRAEEWKSKRVFFMTPQTIMNDLKTGIADPKRIVLLVVDEAHRATGAYAYVEIVKFLQRFNQSFRVMALTATPGSTVEAVQEVIDGLNISRVEIRTENSLDIREFVHTRNVETKSFDNSPEMVSSMELFAKALQPAVDKLRNQNAYWGRDPIALTPFGLTKARQEWNGSAAGRAASWPVKGMINSIFTVLASLAHAIDLLKYHGIGPFFRSLASFEDSVLKEKKGGKCASQIVADGNFKVLMNRLRSWTKSEDFVGHPKLEYLRQVILNHFLDAGDGNGRNGKGESNTRVMIFSHFRDSAEEIVRVLKKHQSMIRPHVFVGQANAKGSEGMDQKTQLDVVSKFKSGTYNTIVATSIGEEGLDIGEVDLIVCYDSHSSPIRMLQRMGRTGRKRAGNIIVLLTKGKEEESYAKAKDNYEKMQQLIASGTSFSFHDDKSPRIIPRDIQPEVEEKVIEIPVENSQPGLPEPAKRARPPKRPPKKFHMPDDVETGFTKASRLGRAKTISAGTKRKRVARSPSTELEEIPDSDDFFPNRSQELAENPEFQAIVGKPVPRLRMDAYPELQRSLRPTRYIRHGRRTRQLVKTLRKIASLGSDCEDEYRALLDDPDRDDTDFESVFTEQDDDVGLANTSQCREQTPETLHLDSDELDLIDIDSLLPKSTRAGQHEESHVDSNEADHASLKLSQRRKHYVISDDSDISE
ncbi:3'-5' DNA helicase [Emydomyces testavorans]|uniref:ATP-dependent DNA helicase n=1 Tax=Emydomyces testavorans TaxID=2070801 RepID=A0AAF0DL64_9EURO|nr:3'-5' DNA helicase [Emydomyces testavorans]